MSRDIARDGYTIGYRAGAALSGSLTYPAYSFSTLIEAIGKNGVQLLPQGGISSALILDESGIPKQGTESVGVTRQYCGALGKVHN